MARPTPVFPLVGSTIVPPLRRRPRRSASSIMSAPMRSFTEPPGFRCSSFATIVGRRPAAIRPRRTSGVWPTSASTSGAIVTRSSLGAAIRYAAPRAGTGQPPSARAGQRTGRDPPRSRALRGDDVHERYEREHGREDGGHPALARGGEDEEEAERERPKKDGEARFVGEREPERNEQTGREDDEHRRWHEIHVLARADPPPRMPRRAGATGRFRAASLAAAPSLAGKLARCEAARRFALQRFSVEQAGAGVEDDDLVVWPDPAVPPELPGGPHPGRTLGTHEHPLALSGDAHGARDVRVGDRD